KRGFTRIELLITIIILSVLAAIAIPGFSKSKTKNDAAQAVTYLRAIRLAEKMHYAKTEAYVACGDSDAVKANLGVEISSSAYGFSVTIGNVDSSVEILPATDPKTYVQKPGFTVTATDAAGNTLTLTQDGIWDAPGGALTAYKPAA
ncbi:MAG: prepilin-type N-terminal cleavage/methylation domain-containing protein, partial [Kiritimatiellales bacterium]